MSKRDRPILTIIALIIGVSGLGIGLYSLLFNPNFGNESGSNAAGNIYYCSSGSQLQSTIDAIGSANGIIIITQDISISDTIDIDGGGDYVIQGAGAVTLTVIGDCTAIEVTDASSCTIKDLTIDGTAITSSSPNLITVSEVGDNPVHIQNIKGFAGAYEVNGVRISSDNVWVRDCFFSNVYRGIYSAYSSGGNFIQNEFKDMIYVAIMTTLGSFNNIQGNLINGTIIGIDLDRVDDTVVSGNSIQYMTSRGIRVVSYGYYGYRNTIMGNTIFHDVYTSGDHYGIHVEGADYNSFLGNVIFDMDSSGGTSYGFVLESGSEENTVVGNNLYSNEDNTINYDAGDGNFFSGNNQG